MSSAMYDGELHAVPDIPATKAKLAKVLTLRYAASKAFEKARSLTGSAVRRALNLFHHRVEATGGVGVLSWLSDQARDAMGLFRRAGIVPTIAAVISAPPIAAVVVRAARVVGMGILSIAKWAWTGIKSLLGRCGKTGKQISDSLSHTGTRIANAVSSVADHPIMVPIVHALKTTLALVRPVSQGLVGSRTLAALIPILWLRAVIMFLFMPVVADFTVVGNIWRWATSRAADTDPAGSDDAQGTDDSQRTAIPMPSADIANDVDQSDAASETSDVTDPDDQQAERDQHLNRASRRAQQRADAHAWRLEHPRN